MITMGLTQAIPSITPPVDKEAAISLKALSALFQALNQQGVKYCHWKSNLRLERSLRGQTDLDLLVDRAHTDAFKELLESHQVKPFLAPPGKTYPGIENYLGFDPTSGNLFHLHVHYQLVLGEQFVKNYHIPLEDHFLDSDLYQFGVKVPTPELELIVLSIRALLKYRDRDAIKDLLSIRTPGIPSHILSEIHWLLDRTSREDVSRKLREISHLIPADLVLEFLETVINSPRSGRQLYLLRQRVRRALHGFQRDSRFHALSRYYLESWRRRQSFLRYRADRRMTLPGKGLTVALVGIDGSGKTTLSKELAKWLSWKLDVHPLYLGSKKPSWLSKSIYLAFRIVRRSQSTFSSWFGEKNAISNFILAFRQVFLYCHYLSNGFDRYRRQLEGKRLVEDGSIVIFDRFPLTASLDGPQIHLIANGTNGKIARALSNWEQQLYRRFQSPNLLMVLQLSPEISLKRKPDHRWEAVNAKSQIINELASGIGGDLSNTNWVTLNAEHPLEEVFHQVKGKVWEFLRDSSNHEHAG